MDKFVGKLSYIFAFKEGSPWSNKYAFERDLGDFFMAHGAYPEMVPNVEGDTSPALVLLCPRQELLQDVQSSLTKSNQEKNTPISKQLSNAKKLFVKKK